MITIDSKTELGLKIAAAMNDCGSDKESSHSYSEGYAYLINKTIGRMPKTFLEIGIANVGLENSSLHGWASVFTDAEIYGIDIDPRKMIESDRIKTFVVDQSDPLKVSAFKGSLGDTRFDVILDDGSHVFDHAATTFKMIFSRLSDNGVYMIEDIGKIDGLYGQSVADWGNLLSSIDNINYEIIDCNPSVPADDSILIGVWKKVEKQES